VVIEAAIAPQLREFPELLRAAAARVMRARQADAAGRRTARTLPLVAPPQ
jgi:hypothetical protein